MGYRIQNRRDTAERWAEVNPILLEGEVGYVTDNPNQHKIGDGIHRWNDLPLRGYTGTIAQEFGNDENAVVSQKAVTEKLSELGSEVGNRLDEQYNEISDFKKTITDQVNNYRPIEITGDVINAADEEDLTSDEDNLLKLKDRNNLDGMGHIILRKNKTFAEQLTQTNTIYEIRYNFDLNGEEVTIPEGCVLDFQGGSLNNGSIILSSDVNLIGNGERMENLTISHLEDINNIQIYNLEFLGNKSIEGNATYCFVTKNYKIASNVIIEKCKIHGYNAGIAINGNNVIIVDNVLYDNGHKDFHTRTNQNDIVFFGQYIDEVNTKNNIIRNNKCLSYYVDRHIDAGENYFFNNIIIDGNICMTCDENGLEEIIENDYIRHCIMAGYAGTSEIEKQVIVTNNICKSARWSGIYIRADNTEETADTSKYVAVVTNNIIEHIHGLKDSDTSTAIHVELKEGSIIANNVISDVRNSAEVAGGIGISIGFVYSKGHTYVHDNFIKNVDIGIINDSWAKRIDICRNRIVNVNTGITINEAKRTDVVEGSETEFCNIDGNIIRECKVGIRSYNTYSAIENIIGNTIIGRSKVEDDSYGIYFQQRSDCLHPIFIKNNTISIVKAGVGRGGTNFNRNEEISNYIDYNNFINCTTAISVGNNNANQLFIVEGNIYKDCDNQFGSQSWAKCVYNGKHYSDGRYIIYDDGDRGDTSTPYGYVSNAQVCFFKKLFKKGDVVIPTNAARFTKAICLEDYAEVSNSGSKWRMDNARLNTSNSEICAVAGQIVYDTTLKDIKFHNGTEWVRFTPLSVFDEKTVYVKP